MNFTKYQSYSKNLCRFLHGLNILLQPQLGGIPACWFTCQRQAGCVFFGRANRNLICSDVYIKTYEVKTTTYVAFYFDYRLV